MFTVYDIPNAKNGDFIIDEFEITQNTNTIYFALQGRGIAVGKYKRLKRGSVTVMSNTPAELRDHRYFVNKAKGSVLINGLGIGAVISELLMKPEIKKITVIEKYKEVIELVAPYIKDDRVVIINADAFKYKPEKGETFDCVWHDIWDTICSDNLPEMSKLHRKYAKITKWQSSWARSLCLQMQRESKANDRLNKIIFHKNINSLPKIGGGIVL